MRQEKSQHLRRRVGSARIGVGARGTAARPGVSGAVDGPVFEDVAPAGVGMDRARIAVPARSPPAMHLRLRARRSLQLREKLIAVVWMHRAVAITVKNDGRDRWPVIQDTAIRPAAL